MNKSEQNFIDTKGITNWAGLPLTLEWSMYSSHSADIGFIFHYYVINSNTINQINRSLALRSERS